MGGSVLVVAEAQDLHAEAVGAFLRREHGVESIRVDTSAFPATSGSFRIGTTGVRHVLEDVELGDVRSVWWRRAFPPTVPPSNNPSDDEFRQAECEGFIHGLVWSLPAAWVNHPGAERVASRKLVQLTAARCAGLAVPETLITNDPDQALDFVESHPRPTIYKRTGTSRAQFSETRLMTAQDVPRLNSISNAPTTFQEYIEAEADLRVVWIAGRSWTVRIDSQAGAGWLDSRLDNTVEFTPYSLPEAASRSVDDLMRRLGLAFGVIDLRIGRNREVYFLEVNPQGQFAYLEIKTGLPILRDLAACLAEPASDRSATSSPTPSECASRGR